MQPVEQGMRGLAAALLAVVLGAGPAVAAPSMAMCQARYAAMAANARRIIDQGMAAYNRTGGDAAGWTVSERAAISAMKPLLESRKLPADETDLKIVERADALLPRPAVWNRHGTRDCPEGAATLSLFCALHDAAIALTGKFQPYRTGLQAVRFAIRDAAGDDLDHPLTDYNNLPSTSFGDIKMILHTAEAHLRTRLDKQAHCAL